MPPRHKIVCEDCGAERATNFRNTRFCQRCRVLRDLQFVGDRHYRCSESSCSQDYAPVARGDKYCPVHAYGSGHYGRCKICGEHAEFERAGIDICVTCMRDPAQRKLILRALKQGQRKRQAENGVAETPKRRQLGTRRAA